MKPVKIFQFFLTVFISFVCFPAKAEEAFSENLAQSLVELKNNVEQLTVSNQTLALKNDQLKADLKGIQITSQKLLQENSRLEADKAKLQESTPLKAEQIERENKNIADLDQQIASLAQQTKDFQNTLESKEKEEKDLSGQMQQLSQPKEKVSEDLPVNLSKVLLQKQKEKLAILKLISESENRQQMLQEKFLDSKKVVPGEGSLDNDKTPKKEYLNAQIVQLQDEIGRLNAFLSADSKSGWSEQQIQELEGSVNKLERNSEELRALIKRMQFKAQQLDSKKDQNYEHAKIQSQLDQLKRDRRSLKIDLAELQQQMVILDKRKSSLEALSRK